MALLAGCKTGHWEKTAPMPIKKAGSPGVICTLCPPRRVGYDTSRTWSITTRSSDMWRLAALVSLSLGSGGGLREL